MREMRVTSSSVRELQVSWRPRVLLAIGLLAGVLAAGLREMSTFEWLEHRTVETRFAIRGEQKPSERVAIVGLDIDSVGRLAGRPPPPRALDARVVDNLRRAGARAIAFDFTLEQATSRSGDLALARALERARAVVSVTYVLADGRTQPLVGRVSFGVRVRPGNTYLPVDPDGAVRRFPEALGRVPAFANVAGALATGSTTTRAAPARALIDFPGGPGTVPPLSFDDVAHGRFEPSRVRDRVVIIGPTAPVLNDLHPTAVGGGQMSGAEIQAAATTTAIAGFPLRTMPSGATLLLLLLLGGAVPLLLSRRPLRDRMGTGSVAAAGTLVLVAWTVASQFLFDAGTVVDFSTGVCAIVAACAAAASVAALAASRERLWIRALFAVHSPEVVRRVLDHGSTEPALLLRTQVIAGYRIEEELGTGGMGVVYRAHQLALDRDVALKLIHPARALAPTARARFTREARTAGVVGHPNIVPIFHAGEDDGLLYIAMMLVQGPDLGAMVREGPLEHALLVSIIGQIAAALDAAHERGLIHRDVKPANILVTAATPTHAYLSDFGLAKHLDGRDGVTRSTGWVGTLDYLAPELAAGGEASARSDVYALAAVLYECATGVVPFFDAPSDAAKLTAHANAARPSAAATRPGTPPAIDAVVARGLAINPADRYPNATELARAAGDALGIVRRPQPQQPAGSAPLAAGQDTIATTQ
jgi:CHASE2 domain-containing sensor protein